LEQIYYDQTKHLGKRIFLLAAMLCFVVLNCRYHYTNPVKPGDKSASNIFSYISHEL